MVQAPHSATPQPYFVPVSPSSSLRYQSSGIGGAPSKARGWRSKDCVLPLTCNLTIGSPPSSVHKRPSCSQQRCCDETRFQSPFFDEDRPAGGRVSAQIFARALTEDYRQLSLPDNKFA